jgi:hypothetical protein
MKRRRFIAALGGMTGVSSVVVGSGAFNYTNVERTISVAVVEDYAAFLTLTQRGTGERSELDGNPTMLEFNIPGDDEGDYPSGSTTDPDGLGTDSVYRFDDDAAHDESGLFGITNQGTDPVEVYSTQAATSGVPSVTIFDVDSGELLTENDPSDPLGVGETLVCGLEVDTHGVNIQTDNYDVSLSINAEVPS